jgi:hypothetical protein
VEGPLDATDDIARFFDMSDSGIIHGFRARRQIEDAIAALGRTTTEPELIVQARDLADKYPPDWLAAAVLRHLGDASSQVRGGLGHLCALLPPQVIAAPLRDVVGNRQKLPIERMSALLILERYLGETVSPALMNDLAGNDDIAMQSLLEAIEEGRINRHVQLEYVTQMQEHGVDVAFMVLGLLDRVAADDRVEMLRLIAQDQRAQVARTALDRLAALATVDDNQRALRALHTLAFTLSPSLMEQVRRSLRKLQFTGRRYEPPLADGWRALLGPADVGGYFNLWFVRNASDHVRSDGVLLSLMLALHQGIVQCSGVESMVASQLPPQRSEGDLALVNDGEGGRNLMLETPFEIGRWLLLRTLDAHWRHEEARDLPEEYKLYNDLIWQFNPPALPDEHRFAFEGNATSGLEQPDMHALTDAADALVVHPVMRTWVQWAANIWTMLAPAQLVASFEQSQGLIDYILREIDAMPQRGQFLENMATALSIQALWLAISGNGELAAQAALYARWMRSLPMRQNPLLAALLMAGLSGHAARRQR